VEFTLKAASIDTSNENRDKDLRGANFFDVEKFPEITFKSTSVKAAGKDRYDVTGTLTMRGVAREVTLPVSFLGFGKDPWGNEKAGFSTDVTLNRKDFGIVWNKALDSGGVLLGDEVWVSINLETAKKKEAASN
jgi:polyisoprenoid-binding protein YceI